MDKHRPPAPTAGNVSDRGLSKRPPPKGRKKWVSHIVPKTNNLDHSNRTRDRNRTPQYKECICFNEDNRFEVISPRPSSKPKQLDSISQTSLSTTDSSEGAGPSKPRTPRTFTYDTMIRQNLISDTIIPFMRRFNLDDAQHYTSLTSDCFVKEIGDFYYCALCCERERIDPKTSEAHTSKQRHVNLYLNLRSQLLNEIPNASSINMFALEYLTKAWLGENMLTDIHSEARMAAMGDFSAVLSEVDPSCFCRVIGSFYSGSSLADSDVNLELMHPNSKIFQSDPRARDSMHHKLVDPDAEYGHQINQHTLHYDLISNAADTLHKILQILLRGYSLVKTFNVKSSIEDLNRKTPTLVLLHEPTRVKLEITCYAEASYKLACLLKNYIHMDRRAFELSLLVKHWARICKISNPKQGTLTPETFVILVIHFLQRVEPPVLPYLHELVGKADDKQKKRERALVQQFDLIDLSDKQDSAVAGNRAIGAPDVPLKISDEDVDEEYETTDQELDPETIDNINWRSDNTDPTHLLFIKFLEFSMKEFASTQDVISIRSRNRIKTTEKAWNTEIKAIENPVRPAVNLARNIGSIRTYEYIRRCFANGFYYLTSIPMVSGLRRVVEPLPQPTEYIRLFFNLDKFDFYFAMKESQIKTSSKKLLLLEMINQNLFARNIDVIKELIEYFILKGRDLDKLPLTIAMNYDNRLLVPPDSISTVFCWLCRSIGHERTCCPRAQAMTLQEKEFDQTIDSVIQFDHEFVQLYLEDMIQIELAEEHSRIVQELAKSICTWTGYDCELRLFGSTVNLLGGSDSDLDICMTLKDNPTGRGVDCVKILEATVECLRHNDNVVSESIEPVLLARVPIIKFKYKNFDIDLSMYNQCAIHNSMLLRSYVLIDYRVAQLFHLVKRYAKACGIADASRGSLSSYAWSLLVIHFLQHTDPPILPVLQEAVITEQKPVIGVNGWNVWFNENVDNKSMPQNGTNMTTLFKQFLFYFANFDFNQYVVSIRTSRLLTKFQKNWTSCMIAIEDPFELTYNLSGRLDDPMALYIRNSFAKTYRYVYKFQLDVKRKSQAISLEIIRYLFRGHAIMGSEPPYRGCRRCHRIGHKLKDCPERQKELSVRKQKDNDKGAPKRIVQLWSEKWTLFVSNLIMISLIL